MAFNAAETIRFEYEGSTTECHRFSYVEVRDADDPVGASARAFAMFYDGEFVGSAFDDAYQYINVASHTADQVTFEFMWPLDTDPLCCPTGGPIEVRVRWDGSTLQILDPIPSDAVVIPIL